MRERDAALGPDEAEPLRPRAGAAGITIPAVEIPERIEPDQHILLWQIHGGSDVRVDGLGYELVRGQALWVPVGSRHGFTVRRDSVVKPLFFGSEVFRCGANPALVVPTIIDIDRTLEVLMLAHDVATHTLVEPRTGIWPHIVAAVESAHAPASSAQMPSSASAHRVAGMLRAVPSDPRGVTDLARAVHTSPRSLQRAFAAETGMTLRRWRSSVRVDAAAALLRRGTSVEATAHLVGYSNVNSFRRVFVERLGVTPGAYRDRELTD